MNVKKLSIHDNAYPSALKAIASSPKTIYYVGADPSDWLSRPKVAIVGSRGVTPYGKQVTSQLAKELTEYGVVIISGLALGVDGAAHTACLDAGGTTVAVLGTTINKIYPASHTQLAKRIVEQGGTIISEYTEDTPGYQSNFIARNRIVSGLADAILVTEASDKSGTLHTARFALEQGKDVLAVPGNINSPNSVGTNNLIKSGATPVTSIDDILHVLNIDKTASAKKVLGDTAEEQAIIALMQSGIADAHELLVQSKLEAIPFNQALTMLELSGKIYPLGNNHWSLK